MPLLIETAEKESPCPHYANRLEASTGADLKRIFGGKPPQSLAELEDVDLRSAVLTSGQVGRRRVSSLTRITSAESLVAKSGHHLGCLGDLHHLLRLAWASSSVNQAIRSHHEEVNAL